ncbi:hypothetical protein DW061_15465 [Ruminococcus sp. AF42-9BH]|nr:hypothetical protein DW061_15465 [Ruminococcus sp. AF42-9BH]
MANNTIFDDVFRTMLEKMPELVIPLINEVFGTNYPADIPIEQQRNEHQTKSGEKITDSRLKIADKIYHIECQSTSDTEMVIRMIEYDFAISLESKKIENGRYRIYFPHSCVLYLRGKGRSNTIGMDIVMPNGQIIKYDLPAIYVENYTTDVIFQKKLLFLLPFYIMRYEKSREKLDKNPKELRELLQEYEKIAGKLEDSLLGRGREAQHRYLVEVIIRISDYIFANSEKTRKGVNAAMGGEVLDLKTDKLINEIRQDVKEEVRDEVKMEIVVYMLKKGINTLEEIADSTNLSLEQVKKIKEEQKL